MQVRAEIVADAARVMQVVGQPVPARAQVLAQVRPHVGATLGAPLVTACPSFGAALTLHRSPSLAST